MKKLAILVLPLILLCFITSCGGGSTPPTDITVTFSPENGSTNQATDVAITATFSSAVTTPSDWRTVFTVTKSGDSNECTAYALDSTSTILTCSHAALDQNTTYTSTVSGFTGVANNTASFSTGTSTPVEFQLAPVDGAVNQPLNVTVSATAVGGSYLPSNLQTNVVFTLKKSGSSVNLCIEPVDNADHTYAYCPSPALELNSTYTLNVSGIKDSNGNLIPAVSSTFTTTSISGTITGKSTATNLTADNTVSLNVEFSIAPPEAPEITVTPGTAGTCTGTGTTRTCTITGVEACNVSQDYSGSITVQGVTAATFKFNSMDDEFEWGGTVAKAAMMNEIIPGAEGDKCWSYNSSVPASIDNFTLLDSGIQFTAVTGAGDKLTQLWKIADPLSGFAVSTKILPTSTVNGTMLQSQLKFTETGSDGDFSVGSLQYPGLHDLFPDLNDFMLLMGSDGIGAAAAKAGGGFASITQDNAYYVCFVAKDYFIYSFLSLDGSSWIQTSASNMQCLPVGIRGCAEGGEGSLTSFDASTWIYNDEHLFNPQLYLNGKDLGTAFTQVFRYVRFNGTSITGTSADCPSLAIGTTH